MGDFRRAQGLWDRMIKQRQVPNVLTYTAAISTCVENAETGWAFALLQDMQRRRVQPNRLTGVRDTLGIPSNIEMQK